MPSASWSLRARSRVALQGSLSFPHDTQNTPLKGPAKMPTSRRKVPPRQVAGAFPARVHAWNYRVSGHLRQGHPPNDRVILAGPRNEGTNYRVVQVFLKGRCQNYGVFCPGSRLDPVEYGDFSPQRSAPTANDADIGRSKLRAPAEYRGIRPANLKVWTGWYVDGR